MDQQHVFGAFEGFGTERRTAKWNEPLEEIKEEDELLTGGDLKLFHNVAAWSNFHAMESPLFYTQ